ncbi:hypothetical protein [Candidatus Galacturonibacter soehngenii]|uniref:Uncharacterized protein n=1 Tax=Candidatus Galacturonatibacter soehngenii TaxID=2307010 RepID=A0A7V7UB87_9FIRM|nr:hypothetical protein [Candidatus Galacturonibacter soehngenii]KAB1437853.1 hypothetical protein F7O84_09695 [Candidatus Galacturonibacter soehngenii]MBA4687374.1 hypothetical protein [Candidatus Galacturonibacter soehngenii]
MSEETILKNSLFGGYKKSDVIQYIDEILEEKESKIKQLEDQVTCLIKENKRLKENTKDTAPIPFPTQPKEIQEVEIRKQMELPQGSYLLDKDNQLLMLPDPKPIYQTKKVDLKIYPEEAVSCVAATKELQKENDEAISTIHKNIVPDKELETEDLKQLKEKVEQLELEKQKLMAKLEYSNDLLIDLYKNKE